MGKNYSFINNQLFTRLIDDKFTTSLIFEKWSKKNWLIKNKEELKKILPKIKTSKIVIKPLMESGGNGVQILTKKEATKKANVQEIKLVQEFINSSKGVPGVSTSMHDLRVVMINEKIIYAYIREPQKGSYLANLAQGGSLKIVPNENLPKTILPIVDFANTAFASFRPRIFCIDFMFDENKKPWIVELNSMPGLFFTPEEKTSMLKMYTELLRVFKFVLKK